jgi:hypothetical protein
MAAGFNSEGVCYLSVGEALNARCSVVSSVLADGTVMTCSGVSNLTAIGGDLSYQKISPTGAVTVQLVPVVPLPCDRPTWLDTYSPLIGQYTLLLIAFLGVKTLIGMFKHDNLPS